ncbi:MAG: hypothetical protein JNL60_01145 [Bacteroidia bacterium]|nr:hypothetical protein [Bacteroidia bacterium]
MKRLYILILALVFQFGKSQIQIPLPELKDQGDRNWVITDILDSLMNKTEIRNGIICITDNTITIDTVITGKVKRYDADSVTVGKFLKKNQKKISSKEFWGVITANGDCQRYYAHEMYLVWETPSPYIYRFQENMAPSYYFSENLLSPLYSLNNLSINETPLSPESKDVLTKALEKIQRDEEFRIQERREVIADVSLNVLSIILQVMIHSSANHPTYSSEPRTKHQTGPRPSHSSQRR